MKTNIITTNKPSHLTSDEVAREIEQACIYGREISDAAARTIASWWQAPGNEFARLASVGVCDADELAQAIVWDYESASVKGKVELDMLGTWALNHPSREA